MNLFRKFIGNLYINTRWYLILAVVMILFLAAYFFNFFFVPASLLLAITAILSLIDYLLLFALRGRLKGERIVPAKLSLGDENTVSIVLHNQYPYSIWVQIIDELPVQFQERNFELKTKIRYNSNEQLQYSL